MSAAIPPNWMGSVNQTAGAAGRAAAERQREKANEVERVAGTFADNLQNVIENSDRDSQVYSDAEGGGSQGRPASEPGDEDPVEAGPQAESDGEHPSGSLDLQA